MHRDLKTANIFLMKNGICKLGDLNVAKIYNGDLLNSKMGTPCYAAPEIWNHKNYTFKSDIWSLGIILYELCTFNLPFYGSDYKDTYKKLMKGYYSSIPNHYSHELNIIINMLLQFNPNNKPTCNQILDNYIIKKKLKVFSVFLELIKKRKFLIFDLIKLNVLKVVKILLNYFLNFKIIKMK